MLVSWEKSLMKKIDIQSDAMPKTILGFYKKIFNGLWWLLGTAWVIRFIAGFGAVLWPNYQRWIIGMLENAPTGINLLTYCLPTILLITGLNMTESFLHIARGWVLANLGPRVQRKISESLTDYVHSQSMSFWVNRMAGQIYSRIGDITSGIQTIIYDVWGIFVASES